MTERRYNCTCMNSFAINGQWHKLPPSHFKILKGKFFMCATRVWNPAGSKSDGIILRSSQSLIRLPIMDVSWMKHESPADASILLDSRKSCLFSLLPIFPRTQSSNLRLLHKIPLLGDVLERHHSEKEPLVEEIGTVRVEK